MLTSRKSIYQAKCIAQGHQSEGNGYDQHGDPSRKFEEGRAAHLSFKPNEFNAGPCQKTTDGSGTEMGNGLDGASPGTGEPAGENINGDVFTFFGGDGRTDKSHPYYQITNQRVTPGDSGVKKISKHNLRKSH